MVESTEIALVRHGKYDHMSGHLTDEGRRQADRAAAELVEGCRFLGVVILTSPAARAVETADRISVAVGVQEGAVVIKHPALQIAGEHPEAMRNLRSLTRTVIEDGAPALDYDGRLIVVTHMPLVARMMGLEGAEYGSVHFYEGDGRSPVFNPDFESVLQDVLG